MAWILLLRGASIAGTESWPAWTVLAIATGLSVLGSAWLLLIMRRRYRAELNRANAREAYLSTIITSEPACVKTVSRDLKLLTMNPAGLTAIEADSMEQVQGADLSNVVHPEHLEQFRELNDRVFAGESVSERFRICGLKGTVRWMETYAAPLRDAEGRVLSHLAVTHDVSERVAMEHRLVEARDAAIAGTRAKSEFLANMSHEIRTPMNSILGWSEVLQDHLETDSHAQELLSIVARNGRHLLCVIDDLLDLARIESGVLEVETGEASPRQLLHETRDALLPKLADSEVELVVEFDDDLPAGFVSDRRRIRQILINLCNNAAKFTERGRITLRARTDRRCNDASIVFEVQDTGSGIASEDLERVYLAFEQADATASRRHGGVGLGLAISRSLADLLGGSLNLESKVGQGTTARLRLPLTVPDANSATESSPNAPTESREENDLAGKRVLVAEDGRDNQRLISHFLKRAGVEVEIAADGALALTAIDRAAAEQRPFDLVLMDVQMPNLDGHAATRELRAKGVPVPIIALTAHAMVGDRERAIEAGCDGYLTKPVRSVELLAEIQRHVASA